MTIRTLPIPPHFDPSRVDQVWRVPYQQRAQEAAQWARRHNIGPAAKDLFNLCLVAVDVQNTFCLPEFELYVAGRSGRGAVDDTRRLCEFVYRNLASLTAIYATMDTHQALQIFHAAFLINEAGAHPDPLTLVSVDDLEHGVWRVNPAICQSLAIDEDYAQRHLLHYASALRRSGKYDLTIWPYHAMLGGIGHALASSFEEAAFFHTMARYVQPQIQIKGSDSLTEHYSALGPEVLEGPDGKPVGRKNSGLIEKLLQFDAVVIAGQAKSHCVAWTIQDLLDEIARGDPDRAGRVYLLEDCTSPVVVPGIVDYSDQADAAFQRFAAAGMHLVQSTEPIDRWPGIPA